MEGAPTGLAALGNNHESFDGKLEVACVGEDDAARRRAMAEGEAKKVEEPNLAGESPPCPVTPVNPCDLELEPDLIDLEVSFQVKH
jgi:hypothetical protein